MTLDSRFTNFYDSNFDSLNESNTDHYDLLNEAFIDSPRNSNAFGNTSLNDLNISRCFKRNDKKWVSTAKRTLNTCIGDLLKEIECIKFSGISEARDFLDQNEIKPEYIFSSSCLDKFQKSPKEKDLKMIDKQSNQVEELEKMKHPLNLLKKNEERSKCIFTPTFQFEFHKSSNENDRNKLDKLNNRNDATEKHRVCSSKDSEENANCVFESTCLEEYRISGKEHDWNKLDRDDASEKHRVCSSKDSEEKTNCVFKSTYLEEYQLSIKEHDWSKFDKCCNRDEESEKMEPQIKYPVSAFDFIPHELSTIIEVDSLLIDETVESSTSSDKNGSLFTKDPKDLKILKVDERDSSIILNKPKDSLIFPANVLKIIQNQCLEKLLQDPGILDEEDLTLISLDLDSTFNISMETSNKSFPHSCYRIKRSNSEESPSMISFLRHEMECMNDSRNQ